MKRHINVRMENIRKCVIAYICILWVCITVHYIDKLMYVKKWTWFLISFCMYLERILCWSPSKQKKERHVCKNMERVYYYTAITTSTRTIFRWRFHVCSMTDIHIIDICTHTCANKRTIQKNSKRRQTKTVEVEVQQEKRERVDSPDIHTHSNFDWSF